MLRIVAIALVALVVAAAPAAADDVAAGRAIAAQLQQDSIGCSELTGTQSERLGEYAMELMAGSRATHQAMNQRIRQALGAAGSERMHQLMGRSYARCDGARTGPGTAWGWMHDDTWRHMSQADWRDRAGTMMGTPSGGRRWSTGDVAALVGALAAAALLAWLMGRSARRHDPTAA